MGHLSSRVFRGVRKRAPVLGFVGLALVVFGMRRFYPIAFLSLCAFVAATICEEYWRGARSRMRHGESFGEALLQLLRRNQRRYGGYIVHMAVILMFIVIALTVVQFRYVEKKVQY